MSTSIYCTYVTFVSSRNLPPLYIGSTNITKIKNGYHGSVENKEFKEIWKHELKTNPQNFKTFLLSIHFSREEAYEEEIKLQHQYKVVESKIFANKAYQTSTGFTTAGFKWSDEQKEERSQLRKGVEKYNPNQYHTPETRIKIINTLKEGYSSGRLTPSMTGKHHTDATKELVSKMKSGVPIHTEETKEIYRTRFLGENNPNYGVPQPEDRKEKNRLSNINAKRYCCEHCNGWFQRGMFNRWHGDNCKFKNT